MTHKNALARYLAIDRLLLTAHPTLCDIKNHVEKSIGCEVGLRTIQLDIQHMRFSSVLKFYAPIQASKPNRYKICTYRYSNPDYSLIKTLAP